MIFFRVMFCLLRIREQDYTHYLSYKNSAKFISYYKPKSQEFHIKRTQFCSMCIKNFGKMFDPLSDPDPSLTKRIPGTNGSVTLVSIDPYSVSKLCRGVYFSFCQGGGGKNANLRGKMWEKVDLMSR